MHFIDYYFAFYRLWASITFNLTSKTDPTPLIDDLR